MSASYQTPSATSYSGHPEIESADAALQEIVKGFLHFHHEIFPQQKQLYKKLATGQRPKAMFIACADSRIAPELITQSAPGDLFVTRNVGNVVPTYGQLNGGVSTAIEYAVLALGIQHIIICGHSDCGAMRAVLNPQSLKNMPKVETWLRHVAVAKAMVQDNCACGSESEIMQKLSDENVIAQLQHLRTHPSVASRMAMGQLFVHGWMYDIATSKIKAYDVDRGRFMPLNGTHPIPTATPKARF
ncbi:carbonic anhydrase [Pseudomonas sp. MAFF 212408]|uniref:Carbonic anhydrase n=1 Tax=Pseudomonas kitaguniensis TaxID=2607908 RepID=A0A5N7KKY1_9PSED|nr:carbonic anhydrase [Pseudomonas kitaguniensis]MPR02385.1 carbonic anhydrase [Pseudomonas kitaguniensis]